MIVLGKETHSDPRIHFQLKRRVRRNVGQFLLHHQCQALTNITKVLTYLLKPKRRRTWLFQHGRGHWAKCRPGIIIVGWKKKVNKQGEHMYLWGSSVQNQQFRTIKYANSLTYFFVCPKRTDPTFVVKGVFIKCLTRMGAVVTVIHTALVRPCLHLSPYVWNGAEDGIP